MQAPVGSVTQTITGDVVGHRAKPSLALAQRGLGPFALGDLGLRRPVEPRVVDGDARPAWRCRDNALGAFA